MPGRPGTSHRGSDKQNPNRLRARGLNPHRQIGTQPAGDSTCPGSHGEAALASQPSSKGPRPATG